MSTRVIGPFQILGTLGSGAHSKILHIRCSGDGKQYALKVVPIESKEDNKVLEQAQHEVRVQGTPEYMAPEQARQGTVNEQTDVYNFGATMYRLVTWRHPPSTVPTSDTVTMNGKTFKALLKPVAELAPRTPRELVDLIH